MAMCEVYILQCVECARCNRCQNMSIFIFLLLLFANLMCCINAAENINEEDTVYRRLLTSNDIPLLRTKRASNHVGRETEQNPNDPKYKEMAKEIIFYHLRINKEDTQRIIVNQVTTQAVSGTKTKIQFQVVLNSGKTISCNSETWEQNWKDDKKITYKCNDGKRSPERERKFVNPKDVDKTKYHGLAEESVRNYITKLPGSHEIVKIKFINNAFELARVVQQLIMYVNLDVIVKGSNFVCSVVFDVPNTVPLNTKCTEKKNTKALGIQWADPSIRKYLDLAKKALLNGNVSTLTLGSTGYDTIVTFVIRQRVSGFKDTIEFIVRPAKGGDYECETRIWEKSNGKSVVEEIICRPKNEEEKPVITTDQPSSTTNQPKSTTNRPTFPTDQPPFTPITIRPDEEEFYKKARESVTVYLKNKQLVIIEINIKNTAFVTTLVQQQKIIYISLDVTTGHSSNYICSVVFVWPNTAPLNTECIEKRNKPDGNHWADPSTDKAFALAEKSLEIKQAFLFASKHDTIVTFFVRQVVSGFKYSIDFIVRLIDGHEYECHSHVFENLSGHIVIEEAKCQPRGSIQPEPKPDDPNEKIYSELGRAYIRIYLPAALEIIESKVINIAYVTPPVSQQKVIYINYDVVVRNSNNYVCSVLFALSSHNTLSTKCIENQNTPGGIQWVDPSEPKYLNIVVKSLLQNITLVREIGTSNYDTIVTFVIRQAVSGYKVTVDFIVRPLDGREYVCHSVVWEQTGQQFITEAVTCQLRGSDLPTPKPNELEPSINKEIYNRIGIAFIKIYISQLPGRHDIVESRIKNIAIVVTLVNKRQILYINYEVAVRPSSIYICSILFELPSHNPLSKKCIENQNTPGGTLWADPSLPKYNTIAMKSITQNTTLLKELGKGQYDAIITFVVQNVDSEYKDTIDFEFRSMDGRVFACHSLVWERARQQIVTESVTCHLRGSHPHTTTPKPNEIIPSYNKEIYTRIGIEIIKKYITELPGRLEILDAKIKNDVIVKTLVNEKNILYINYNLVVRPFRNYICSVIFEIPSNDSLSRNCIEDQGTAGGIYWVDPSSPKYINLAEQWLLYHKNVSKHDIIITLVVQQAIFSGYKDTIEFIAVPEVGDKYKCQAIVGETRTGALVLEGGKCDDDTSVITTETPSEEQDYDYSKYIELGTTAVLMYISNLPNSDKLDVTEARIINIAFVTPPVFQKKIVYLNYDVIIRGSNNYICSVLYEVPSKKPLSTICIENKKTPGAKLWVDPSLLKYIKLAVESLSYDKPLLRVIGTSRYDTIVTFVVHQIISGYKDTIDFIVRVTDGRQFDCQAEVWEKATGKVIFESVSCHPHGIKPPEPKPLNPNEKKYIDKGISNIPIYLPPTLEILETKVVNITYVEPPTTLVNNQQLTMYITYEVVVSNSNNYICSVLFVIPKGAESQIEIPIENPFNAKCIENQYTPGGIQWVSPSEPKYRRYVELSLLLIQTEIREKLNAGYFTIVTFVIQEFVPAYRYTIDYIIHLIDGVEYECRTHVWEKTPGQGIAEDVTCKPRGQGQLEEIFQRYVESGKLSIEIYFNTTVNLPRKLETEVKSIVNVTSINRREILYINYVIKDSNHICTVVFVLPNHNSLSTHCTESQIPGGFEWVDPSKPEYLELAKESLLIRKECETTCVTERDVTVTFVVQQAAGRNDKIDFVVQPISGQDYECRSKVSEQATGPAIIDDLSCHWHKNRKIQAGVKFRLHPVRQELENVKQAKHRDSPKKSRRRYWNSRKHNYRPRG